MPGRWLGVTVMVAALGAAGFAQTAPPPTQPPPVPKPFPGSNPATTPPPGKPGDPTAPPAAIPAAPERPSAPAPQELAGAPIYPAADFLEVFDAGRGQKYYIYGTNTPYLDIIAFYRKQLGSGGQELFRTPAMQRFDLGRFDDQTMAYPPSIVVKDYSANGSPGYLFVAGTTEKRYRRSSRSSPRSRAKRFRASRTLSRALADTPRLSLRARSRPRARPTRLCPSRSHVSAA